MDREAVLQKLTLEQKCALLSGADVFQTRTIPEEGISSIWLSDGPHGIRKQAGPADHLGLNPSEPSVCFPTAAAVACSWDEDLGEKIGAALAEEAIRQDVNVVLGPGLNIKRSPLCGRNFEYFSEDPYLAGKMAASYVRGIEKSGVAACPKHFAVNNQETRRMASDSIVDERALREIYLTGFEIAVKEGRPKTIMSSYNLINGVYANENEHLLVDILRKDWGFDGAVVTDWGGSNDHALGVKAGSTLEMPAPGWDSIRELMAAVKSGKVTEVDVDARVLELLKLIDAVKTERKTGKAEKRKSEATATLEYKADLETEESAAGKMESGTEDQPDIEKLAYIAAAKSLTLLKNEDGLLPLKPGTRVALIGDFAETPRYQGAGSSLVNVPHPYSVLECMGTSGLDMAGYAKGFDRLGKPDEELLQEALDLAKRAEAVILCLGLDEVQESEGLDRLHMRMAGNQLKVLQALSEVNSRIVVVLFSGSAVETGWRKDCKSLLYASLGGQAGGMAVVDAVTGIINPCGKLAETWPESYDDTPARFHFAGTDRTVEYRESIYVGYRYYQKKQLPVAFPFGYGLSYTRFQYGGLTADEKQASFTVTNVGDREGAEIAQLYIAKPDSRIFRADRELKGFARVELKPGESRTVTIPLDDKAFRYWNRKTGKWEAEDGAYLIQIGSSCEDIRLEAAVTVKGTNAPNPYEGQDVTHYLSGDVQNVPDREFQAVLGHAIPVKKREISRNMTFGEMKYGRSPLGWLACAIMTGLLNRSLKKGKPDLNLLFIYNMPLRAIAKMTNGIVSMGMVDGMVMELKGFWIIGILRIIYEYFRNLVLNRRMERRASKK